MSRQIISYTQTLYKGDVLSGAFYLLTGCIALGTSVALHFFTTRLGYYYLSISMLILALYLIGKGSYMIYMYKSRYDYYKKREDLTGKEHSDERSYTTFRIHKKNSNRRSYMYAIILGCIIAFAGVFHQEKGLILSMCIPIVLMSGIEFAIGLLTEFRLSEYLRILNK